MSMVVVWFVQGFKTKSNSKNVYDNWFITTQEIDTSKFKIIEQITKRSWFPISFFFFDTLQLLNIGKGKKSEEVGVLSLLPQQLLLFGLQWRTNGRLLVVQRLIYNIRINP